MQVSVYAKALDGVMGESDFEFTVAISTGWMGLWVNLTLNLQ